MGPISIEAASLEAVQVYRGVKGSWLGYSKRSRAGMLATSVPSAAISRPRSKGLSGSEALCTIIHGQELTNQLELAQSRMAVPCEKPTETHHLIVKACLDSLES